MYSADVAKSLIKRGKDPDPVYFFEELQLEFSAVLVSHNLHPHTDIYP